MEDKEVDILKELGTRFLCGIRWLSASWSDDPMATEGPDLMRSLHTTLGMIQTLSKGPRQSSI